MAEFDLRKLSAPIEALRPEVEAMYKRIDGKWKAVIEQLQKLLIPCDVRFFYADDDHGPPNCYSLDWRKWNGSKRVCEVYHYEEDVMGQYVDAERVTPFEEWGAQQRIDMLAHVPKLFEAAAKQTKEFIQKAREMEGQE